MRRLIILALSLAALTGGVAAQALPLPTSAPLIAPIETATSTAEMAVSATSSPTIDPQITPEPLGAEVKSDVLFPAGVAFQVVFRESLTGIESITLSAAQAGWRGDVTPVPPVNVMTENGMSALRFIWEVPSPPPALFTPITFTWEIKPRGLEAESVETEITLADPRFTWEIINSGELPIRFAIPASRTTAAIIQAQTTSLARLMKTARRDLSPLNLVIFPPGASPDACQAAITRSSGENNETALLLHGEQTGLEIPCDSAATQALYTADSWSMLAATNVKPTAFVLTEAILQHAYPDLFAADAAPQWFKAGLTAYFAGTFSQNDLVAAQAASRSNLLLTALDVVPADANRMRQWQAQSMGTVIYMSSQIGVPALIGVIERIDAGETLDVVWPEVSGQVIEALQIGWRNWIFSPQSAAAYSRQPGLDATPTPIPTRTVMPTNTFLPTFTPTFTLTFTPTVTPSLTTSPTAISGFSLPTAGPTAYPSPTSTVTLTPRPVEAFVLGTIPAETPPSTSDSRPLIVAALAATAATLLLVIILILRRR